MASVPICPNIADLNNFGSGVELMHSVSSSSPSMGSFSDSSRASELTGANAIRSALKSAGDDSARINKLLGALVRYIYNRPPNYPESVGSQQRRAVAQDQIRRMLQSSDDDFSAVMALITGPGKPGLPYVMPAQVIDLLNHDVSDQDRHTLSAKLTIDQRDFLIRVGVNIEREPDDHLAFSSSSRSTSVSTVAQSLPSVASSGSGRNSSIAELFGIEPAYVPSGSDKAVEHAGTKETEVTPLDLGFSLLSKTGNAEKYGAILFFGQKHNLSQSEMQSWPASKKDEVAASQRSILDTLLVLKPAHVFDEGQLEKSYEPGRLRVGGLGDVFRNYVPGSPLSNIQQILLRHFGAAKIYAALRDDVTLHGIDKIELREESEKHFQECEESDVDFMQVRDDRLFYNREKFAMDIVVEFLSRNPQPVALVFGAAHNFSRLIDIGEIRPDFLYKNFSGGIDDPVTKTLSLPGIREAGSEAVISSELDRPTVISTEQPQSDGNQSDIMLNPTASATRMPSTPADKIPPA